MLCWDWDVCLHPSIWQSNVFQLTELQRRAVRSASGAPLVWHMALFALMLQSAGPGEAWGVSMLAQVRMGGVLIAPWSGGSVAEAEAAMPHRADQTGGLGRGG